MRSASEKGQRGFTLIEVMTAAVLLSTFMVGIGTFWVKADRQVNNLVVRQKAIMLASAEMERLSILYTQTSFGVGGPVNTNSYTGSPSLPTTRLTYPTSVAAYVGGGARDFPTTSATNFKTGDAFQVLVDSQLFSTMNRNYIWIDQAQNVMARISWTAVNISPSQCVVGIGGCNCLNYFGLGAGQCQRLNLYLEYPYRLVSGSAVASSLLQTVTVSTIVGRHT